MEKFGRVKQPRIQDPFMLYLVYFRFGFFILFCFKAEYHIFQAGLPTLCVTDNDLELLILLPPPPKFWDYRHTSPHQAYVVLGHEPRASCIQGKHCTSYIFWSDSRSGEEKPKKIQSPQ